ncbi:MAG: ankyrin repeat domain-containing protein [Shewanella sp.]
MIIYQIFGFMWFNIIKAVDKMQQPTENLHNDAYKNAIIPTVLNMIDSGLDLARVDQNNKTSLMFACKNHMEQVALSIIKTKKSNLGQVDKDGKTAFMYACEGNMPAVCLALIKTGKSNLGQVDKDGKTAIMYACEGNMPAVCLAIIKTGEANIGQVDKDGKTTFMYACEGNMSNVCLAIIETGSGEPHHACIDTECKDYMMTPRVYGAPDNSALIKTFNGEVNHPKCKGAPTELERTFISATKSSAASFENAYFSNGISREASAADGHE